MAGGSSTLLTVPEGDCRGVGNGKQLMIWNALSSSWREETDLHEFLLSGRLRREVFAVPMVFENTGSGYIALVARGRRVRPVLAPVGSRNEDNPPEFGQSPGSLDGVLLRRHLVFYAVAEHVFLLFIQLAGLLFSEFPTASATLFPRGARGGAAHDDLLKIRLAGGRHIH